MLARLPRASMGHAVLPPPPATSGLRKLLFCKSHDPSNRLESTLLQVFIPENLKPFGINTYEKQGEGCQLWLTKYYTEVSVAANFLALHQAFLPVAFCPFSIFTFPFSTLSSIFRTLFQVPYLPSPLFATLTKTAGVCTYNSHSGTHPYHSLVGRSLRTRRSRLGRGGPDVSLPVLPFNFQPSTVDRRSRPCRDCQPPLRRSSTGHGSRNTGHESRLSFPYIITSLFRYLSARFARLLLHCSTHGSPTPRPTLPRRSPLARRDRARHSCFAAFHRPAFARGSALLDRNWCRPW
jgi:hypothetical protein